MNSFICLIRFTFLIYKYHPTHKIIIIHNILRHFHITNLLSYGFSLFE